MFLCLNFHSVAEGNPNIVCGVDCHKIYQSAPKGGVKGVHQVGFCKSGKAGFDGCPARLLATNGLVQGFMHFSMRAETTAISLSTSACSALRPARSKAVSSDTVRAAIIASFGLSAD